MKPDFVPVIHGAALDRPDEVDTVRTAEAIAAALTRLGMRSEVLPIDADLEALSALATRKPDLVFNLVEALGGDCARGRAVPERLDAFGLAYTGCGARAWALCTDKTAMKSAMRAAGLPTPAWSARGRGLDPDAPVIVKSLTEHASLGIDAGSVVPGRAAAREIAAREARNGGVFFAEAYVPGREFNLSMVEEAGTARVLPPAEIVFVDYPAERPRIVDYEAKWAEGSFAYENTPRRFDFPPTDNALLMALDDCAREAWAVFGLAGYARADFRVDDAGRPWLLEINTNPCLAQDAGFFASATRSGLTFDTMIAKIVEAAAARAQGMN